MGNRIHQLITRTWLSTAIAVGCCVAAAAPAGADPDDRQVGSDPVAALRCDCRQTLAAGSPALTDEIRRGISEGLAMALPGRPDG